MIKKYSLALLAVLFLFLLYRVSDQAEGAVSIAIWVLAGGILILGYEINRQQRSFNQYREEIRRAVLDLWCHTERYGNDFCLKNEAKNGERMTLFERIALYIKNGGEEDDAVYLPSEHDHPLMQKYVAMERYQLRSEIVQMESRIRELNVERQQEYLDACYGGDTPEDGADKKAALMDSISTNEAYTNLVNEYNFALSIYVRPNDL